MPTSLRWTLIDREVAVGFSAHHEHQGVLAETGRFLQQNPGGHMGATKVRKPNASRLERVPKMGIGPYWKGSSQGLNIGRLVANLLGLRENLLSLLHQLAETLEERLTGLGILNILLRLSSCTLFETYEPLLPILNGSMEVSNVVFQPLANGLDLVHFDFLTACSGKQVWLMDAFMDILFAWVNCGNRLMYFRK